MVISSLFLLTIAFGAHTVTTSSGGTSYNIVEDTAKNFNILVNVTDTAAGSNVTAVNVTIPSSFSYLNGNQSAGTSPVTPTFANTSTVLHWNSSAGLIALNSTRNFAFNATPATPGSYNITVRVTNSSAVTTTNISVTVNDTTTPDTIDFDSTTVANGTNLTSSSIIVNITGTDNGAISVLLAKLYYANGTLANTSTSATSPVYVNFSGHEDGVYIINGSINDTANNVNSSLTARMITVDTTGPTITLSKSSSTKTSINLDVDLTDTYGNLNSTCTSTRGTVAGGSDASQTIEATGLGCGNSYSFQVTCEDSFGNVNTETASFSTDNCGSGGGGGGGGGSSGGLSSGSAPVDLQTTSTATITSREGYVKHFTSADGANHTITFTDVSDESVTLKIQSTPQTLTLNVGDSKQVDLNSDGSADVKVTLDSITNGAAAVTLVSLKETPAKETPTETPTVPTDQPNTDEVAPGDDSGEPTTPTDVDTGSSKTKIVVIGVIVAIIIIGGVIYFMRKQ